MTHLDGFGPGAQAAVATAEREAMGLGHAAIGTEHLLLGVLLGDDRASAALAAAGATVAAARHKVAEAGRGPRSPIDGEALPLSSRAERAVGRAVRFSHQAKAEAVDTSHLLLGVLDIEGTAGQVLRGIGVDVAALRAALVAEPVTPEVAKATAGSSSARCGTCGADVAELTFTIVTATNEAGRTGEAVVFSCGACGVVLGVAPPRT